MYVVDCDGEVFYDDTSLNEDVILVSPNVELSDNSAGTFSAIIPPSNKIYNTIKRFISTIRIRKNGKYIWSGRVISEQEDFYGRKKITCEGALAFLNDVIILPKTYKANSMYDFLDQVFTDYNERVGDSRKIYMGYTTVQQTDKEYKYEADYDSVFDLIRKHCTDPLGGHIFITQNDNKLYFNYDSDYSNTSTQTIDFGSNLIDFVKNFDFSKICTICIPRGKQITESSSSSSGNSSTRSINTKSRTRGTIVDVEEENTIVDIEEVNTTNGYNNDGSTLYNTRDTNDKTDTDKKSKYLTVESVNDNSPYVVNIVTKAQYGAVERIVDFSDVEDPVELLKLATIYMENLQFDGMVLQVKAVDLNMLNASVSSFNWRDTVRCFSIPHGLDRYFPITSVSIPLDKPEDVQYTLGSTGTGTSGNNGTTLSGIIASGEAANSKKFSRIPTRESVLVAAKKNATAILNRKTSGFVNIIDQGDHSEAIIISDNVEWNKASQYWKFDINGLGFYKDGNLDGIAITMDGQIVADYITAGSLNADIIKTGYLGDTLNGNYIDLEQGTMYMNAEFSELRYLDANENECRVTFNEYLSDTSEAIDTHTKNIVALDQRAVNIETNLNGISTSVKSLKAGYGICPTSATYKVKYVNCEGFTLFNGAVIVVKFKNRLDVDDPKLNVNSTGDYSILANDVPIKKGYWKSNETLHFVYYDQFWYVANGATESKIVQLADSISLTVTGSLGSTATIKLSANGKDYKESIDMKNVRKAFSNDKTSIVISAGTVKFSSNTLLIDSSNCKLSANGTLTATNCVMQGKVIAGQPKDTRLEMDVGCITGYTSNKKVGTISPNSGVTNLDTGVSYNGIALAGTGCIDIRTPRINVAHSYNQMGSWARSGSFNYISDIKDLGNGSIQWSWREMRVIDGLVVSY